MSMLRARPTAFTALLLAAAAAAAQTGGAAGAAPAASGAIASAPRAAEPTVQRHVVEDDAVRIEELRVRGQTVSIVVRHKSGARSYEVVPASPGRDLSSDRGATGQRVWSLFSF